MDPLYEALSLFRRRQFERCSDICGSILERQPLDQAAWCLKMRALTQRVRVDDLEDEDADVDVEGLLDEHAMASAPRPGTTMRGASAGGSARPHTASGRPISGVVRPSTRPRPGSALNRLRTARPLSSAAARAVRLGTASMASAPGAFVQVSRLNLPKYAEDRCLAKPLFEYLVHHEGDLRTGTALAGMAARAAEDDWYWAEQMGRCCARLGMVREAEQRLRRAAKRGGHVETYVRLARVYQKLDQPLSATEICRSALEVFPDDVTVLTELARVSEATGDAASSVRHYRAVVVEDATNTEAIACIGLHHFYNNRPELALRYYRRALALGAHSAELYNNLGLCCLHSQQLDLTYACFRRALDLALEDSVRAEVWYNVSHLATAAGDVDLAMRCLGVCLFCDPSHAAALNNLAVLHRKRGSSGLAKAYLQSAKALRPEMPEASRNLELLLGK